MKKMDWKRYRLLGIYEDSSDKFVETSDNLQEINEWKKAIRADEGIKKIQLYDRDKRRLITEII